MAIDPERFYTTGSRYSTEYGKGVDDGRESVPTAEGTGDGVAPVTTGRSQDYADGVRDARAMALEAVHAERAAAAAGHPYQRNIILMQPRVLGGHGNTGVVIAPLTRPRGVSTVTPTITRPRGVSTDTPTTTNYTPWLVGVGLLGVGVAVYMMASSDEPEASTPRRASSRRSPKRVSKRPSKRSSKKRSSKRGKHHAARR